MEINHNAPSTRSAFSISSSMASSPVLEDRYKKGKATIVEEITRAYLVNITGCLKNSSTICPMGQFLPDKTINKKPITEGGNTNGWKLYLFW
ncbi:hypothetical protein F4694_002413 [Bacillus niacini]|uniref:Uncharacterized protein n=1 Tax=Neobacillus niacini TaxID=86668 RepID=A0A852TA47_9BACI|nr:hypothetical protein [Neobacillus niacini]NYE05660.1 hypothetical protein [Neobacillus niacini]